MKYNEDIKKKLIGLQCYEALDFIQSLLKEVEELKRQIDTSSGWLKQANAESIDKSERITNLKKQLEESKKERKQDIINAYIAGCDIPNDKVDKDFAEQYYNSLNT